MQYPLATLTSMPQISCAPKQIAYLEKEMLQAARDLKFERAAKLRDQLKKMRERGLILWL